jgi:hypothetical protein
MPSVSRPSGSIAESAMRSRHAGDAARPSGNAGMLSEHRNTVASFAGAPAAGPSWSRLLRAPPSGASPSSPPEVYCSARSTDPIAPAAVAGPGPLRLGRHAAILAHRSARDRYLVWAASDQSRFDGRAAIRDSRGRVMTGDGPSEIGADSSSVEGAGGDTIAHAAALWSHGVTRPGFDRGASRAVRVRSRGAPDHSGCGLE